MIMNNYDSRLRRNSAIFINTRRTEAFCANRKNNDAPGSDRKNNDAPGSKRVALVFACKIQGLLETLNQTAGQHISNFIVILI